MSQWYGTMDWPIEAGWECETCGAESFYLLWGFVHGTCRCSKCHTEYRMRDSDGNRVEVPISRLKPEYKNAARIGWKKTLRPISQYSDNEWDYYLEGSQEEATCKTT